MMINIVAISQASSQSGAGLFYLSGEYLEFLDNIDIRNLNIIL